jgi:DNA repair exonuclease SbcCD ATPase subunit
MTSQQTYTPEAPLAPLPRDPDKAIQDVIATIARLQSVYQRETQALEEVDAKAFLAEQDEKFEVAKIYQARVQEVMQRKNELRAANPELKAKLEDMQAEFSQLSHRNMKALKRMQRTMERLGNTIRRAAKEETRKQRTFSYGANGTLKDDEKKRISMGISETA